MTSKYAAFGGPLRIEYNTPVWFIKLLPKGY